MPEPMSECNVESAFKNPCQTSEALWLSTIQTKAGTEASLKDSYGENRFLPESSNSLEIWDGLNNVSVDDSRCPGFLDHDILRVEVG
jgi:hypothetical protein